MLLPRFYKLSELIKANKVIVIYGPRRVGKTTLFNQFLSETSLRYKKISGDDVTAHEAFSSQSIDVIKNYVTDYDLIAIDEAQKIPGIGLGLKILVDHVPGIKAIVTGSASFELAGQVGEPLTGRKFTYTLYPMADIELARTKNHYELSHELGKTLLFGRYPEVVTADSDVSKIQILEELTSSYLLKDILEFEKVKNSSVLVKLLKLLAYQIGSEVSLSELGTSLGMDYKTVARYLDLFEKSFIIYGLGGFSRNLRKEVTKKQKYYFFDIGIRNSLIGAFNSIDVRDDVGALWENYLFMERLKKRAYTQLYATPYFWRTWGGQEVDLIEEHSGKLFGYEFKWSPKKLPKAPKDWLGTYKNASYEVITQDNYLDFIT